MAATVTARFHGGFPATSRLQVWFPVSISQWAGWGFAHPGIPAGGGGDGVTNLMLLGVG